MENEPSKSGSSTLPKEWTTASGGNWSKWLAPSRWQSAAVVDTSAALPRSASDMNLAKSYQNMAYSVNNRGKMKRLLTVIWKQATSPPQGGRTCSWSLSTIVQPYLSGGANEHLGHLIHDSLGPPYSPRQMAAQSVQPFLNGTCHSLPTQNIASSNPPTPNFFAQIDWPTTELRIYIPHYTITEKVIVEMFLTANILASWLGTKN